jgi:hypothetical protein
MLLPEGDRGAIFPLLLSAATRRYPRLPRSTAAETVLRLLKSQELATTMLLR